MKQPLAANCKDSVCDFFNGQTSTPYNNTDIQFALISWTIMSSEAIQPTLPKIALNAVGYTHKMTP